MAGLDLSSRDFLGGAVLDYNAMFAMNFDTSSEGFQSYYKDIAKRLKNRELDVVIVVNMFLTGFDATTLNTLWVDKNLRQHGLVQAYSRTNRILNSVKTYGNIVTFRDLEKETNEAIALFGDKQAGGLVLLKPYAEYYGKYAEKVSELLERFPVGEAIVGEQNQKDFIKLFGAILRLRNILTAFDDFAGNDLLTERQRQDYQSMYLDLRDEWTRTEDGDKEPINEDVVFEIELIKQVEINVDYILMLVRQHQEAKAGGSEDKEILATIDRALAASFSLRSKRDLIEEFVSRLSATADVEAEWAAFVAAKRAEELDRIIAEESLNAEATRAFVEAAFRDGSVVSTGMAITKVLPPVSRFSAGGGRAEKKAGVLDKLSAYVERFLGLG